MYGIVLEGGGTKGAYQIGAWKALKELGVEISGAVGSSVGSINSALIIQDDFDMAYNFWTNADEAFFSNADKEIWKKLASYEFKSKDPAGLKKEIQTAFGIEGIDITPVQKLINDMIDESVIRKSSKDFGLTTISLKRQKGLELFKEDMPQGRLRDFILASCYLPIFKSIDLNGDFYLDGVYYNKLPTNMLINKGYKKIIEILLYPKRQDQENDSTPSEDIEIITIEPTEYLGKTLYSDPKQISRSIKLGYFDTLKVMKKLKGQRYYIDIQMPEPDLSKRLDHLTEETQDKIKHFLFLKNTIESKAGSDWLIKSIIKKLSLNTDSSHTDLIIGVLEYLSEKFDIDRFHVYTYHELLDLLKEKITLYLIGEDTTPSKDSDLIHACIELIKYL